MRPLSTSAIVGVLLAFALLTTGLLAPSPAASATLAQLPRSAYAVRPACAAPSRDAASCLALGLEPRTAAARARVHPLATRGAPQTGLTKASECAVDYPSSCLTPHDLRSAYFPNQQPLAPSEQPQTIAIVDAYNDPNAEADLSVYSTEFGLPQCTKANGCFKQVSQTGSEAPTDLPFPKTGAELEAFAKGTSHQRELAEEAEGWALETATDIEVAHAICQNCHILLVAADSPEYSALGTAENTAALQADEVSNSWGGQESGVDDPAFDHPGVAIVAASGDDGYLNWDQYASRNEAGSPYFQGADYPASSPHVISVGGTRLMLDADGAWQSESPWNSQGAGGSGCSDALQAPSWQMSVVDWPQVGCGQHRANADIAADADPSTGVNVYDSTPYPYEEAGKKLTTVLHWAPIGGTSVASPIIASMIALAGGAHEVAYPSQTIYSHLASPALHDITAGGSGGCKGEYFSCEGSISPLSPLDCGAGAWICNATTGYDGPTGVGTPNGIGAFLPQTLEKAAEEGELQGKPSEEQGEEESAGSEGASGEGSQEDATTSTPPNDTPGPASEASTRSPKSLAGVSRQAPRISALRLTAHARRGLRARRTALGQLAFSFTLTRAVAVKATLAVLVRQRGHHRWRALKRSFAFAASRGMNRRRLHGLGDLTPGTYRLTLVPTGGRARALVVHVG